jgi:hypothetical protein
MLEPPAQQPLADAAERGVLLVDAREPAPIGSAVEPAPVQTSAGSRLAAGGAVGEQTDDFPQADGAGSASFSAPGAGEFSSVAAQTPSAEPARIAVHLDRVRKRYADVARPEPLIGGNGPVAGEATHAKGAHSRIYVPLTTESTATLVIHDDELVAIQLGQLISLFETRLDRPLFVWMKSSSAASKFVTRETLAAAGIKANYESGSKWLVLSAENE